MMMDYEKQIDKELSKSLKDKVIHHKVRFTEIFKARYMEMLPSLIQYKNSEQLSVDFMKVEIALRNGYDVIIGETTTGNIQVIGWAKAKNTVGNPADLWSTNVLKHRDIHFVIPEYLQLNYYKEISYQDDCETGNFVVLRNKNIHYVSDVEIINHYVDELAEIVLSRFSISMQVKLTNIFLGNPNDETVNEVISDLYNGNPYIKANILFDPEEQIYHLNSDGVAQNFQELKREYQNKVSELNNMLGVNSLAVEKSSGVSDEEAKSNRGFTTSNANINLDGRNNGLLKLNKRYNVNVYAQYNDEVSSEFSELHREIDLEEGSNGNNTI